MKFKSTKLSFLIISILLLTNSYSAPQDFRIRLNGQQVDESTISEREKVRNLNIEQIMTDTPFSILEATAIVVGRELHEARLREAKIPDNKGLVIKIFSKFRNNMQSNYQIVLTLRKARDVGKEYKADFGEQGYFLAALKAADQNSNEEATTFINDFFVNFLYNLDRNQLNQMLSN